MNILYGIQLNGNGHITRSIELIDNLLKKRPEYSGFFVYLWYGNNNSEKRIRRNNGGRTLY